MIRTNVGTNLRGSSLSVSRGAASYQINGVSFTPLAWWEASGLGEDESNKYGEATFGSVYKQRATQINDLTGTYTTNIKSATDPSLLDNLEPIQYGGIFPNTTCRFGIPELTISGDFTFIARFEKNEAGFYTRLLENSDSTVYIRLNDTSCRLQLGGSGYTIPFSDITNKERITLVAKRVGNQFSVSLDGGQTFEGSVTCPTSDITFTHLGFQPNASTIRYVLANEELTSAQVAETHDWLKKNNSILSYQAPTGAGVSLSSFSGFFTDEDVDNTTGIKKVGCLTYGDYSFILCSTDEPDNKRDYIIVYKHSTNEYGYSFIGIDGQGDDVHMYGSIFWYNNKIYLIDNDWHYDGQFDANKTTMFIGKSGSNYNISSFTRQDLFNGDQRFNMWRTQYQQVSTYSNGNIYSISQTWPLTSGYQPMLEVLRSTDGGTYWERNIIIEPQLDSVSDYWPYPAVPVTRGEDRLDFFINFYDEVNNERYESLCYMYSTDGYIWRNAANTFSQDIRNRNFLTTAEVISNYEIYSDPSQVANIFLGAVRYKDGVIFGHVLDGVGGHLFMYGDENGFTFNSITASGVTLPLATTLVRYKGWPVKTGTNSYDIYIPNSDLDIVKLSTTDNGLNWTNQGVIENTYNFTRVEGTEEGDGVNEVIYALSETGELFITDV